MKTTTKEVRERKKDGQVVFFRFDLKELEKKPSIYIKIFAHFVRIADYDKNNIGRVVLKEGIKSVVVELNLEREFGSYEEAVNQVYTVLRYLRKKSKFPKLSENLSKSPMTFFIIGFEEMRTF